MLVLTRGCGSRIPIPQYDVSFTILDIHRKKVRIGVSAPSDLDVFREEVWGRVNQKTPDELVAAEPPSVKE
jgi:carbon storage regulator CsrA